MTSFLEGSLAKTIGATFKSVFVDAQLIKIDRIASSSSWDPNQEFVTELPCDAVVENWSSHLIASGAILAGEVKVLILATSLSGTPEPVDRIRVRGVEYTISSAAGSVSIDPAGAVWVVRAAR
jgi:hypothetical protein